MKRRWICRLGAAMMVTCLLFAAASCAKQESPDEAVESVPYDEARLDEYLSSVTYRDLTVLFDEKKETKGEAVWRTVLGSATVREYPAEQTAYYAAQIRAEYRYLAERENMTYEEMLALRGMSEASIEAEARAMVKSDLVFLYIVNDADIRLSGEEKTGLYDRYADKYVDRYGYDRTYVDANLREEVYESMLYDKTMEYLILHNEVTHG